MNYTDLEDAIYLAWRTSDDLDLFFKHHGDHPKPMTEDEVSNMVYGIKQMHDMRMEKLFDVFKRVHKLDEYCTDPEKLAARERVFLEVTDFSKDTIKKGKKK
jgi:hypothetical protein